MSGHPIHQANGPHKTSLIGTSPHRFEAKEKVTGSAQYVDDLQFGPNLLHARLKRSPLVHARILSVDTGRARALPGGHVVVTSTDFPGYMGPAPKRRSFMLTWPATSMPRSFSRRQEPTSPTGSKCAREILNRGGPKRTWCSKGDTRRLSSSTCRWKHTSVWLNRTCGARSHCGLPASRLLRSAT